ncbi:MAG: ATP-dependent protease ATPase subunit HslU [Candidatus Latescibacterota bacterium]|jgi:ATP-dependent HslUV protease ATP-binding subunit HslU
MYHYTPTQVVRELDRFIVKQDNAKKAVAIALRNRWRRQQAPEELREEIVPNNIIMIGPTGVGKTEIARRLARLVGAPFVKVEASNYTEVGYMGRDVESIIRDLMEISVGLVTAEHKEKVRVQAAERVEERLVDMLMPGAPAPGPEPDPEAAERRKRTREKLRAKLRAGELEERTVSVKTAPPSSPIIEIFSKSGLEDFNVTMPGGPPGMANPFQPRAKKERDAKVREARRILEEEETENLLDREKVVDEARERAESNGIVFVDEIDKIAGKTAQTSGPDVSREGVQRDLLPIVEGAAVNTRYGVVRTDHVLFIAAGAFNIAKPSDLIPEFQGRFPIRVELAALGQEDFERILREPDASLIKQYTALLESEGCKLSFDEDAVREIARVAFTANERSENIGARRLQTVMATLLEDVLFELPESGRNKVNFKAEDVRSTLDSILADEDLTRYIL